MRVRAFPLAIGALVLGAACVRAPGYPQHEMIGRLDAARGPSPSDVYLRCPPAVRGARVDVQDVEAGVAIDVTGNDAKTTEDIRARTQALLAVVERGKTEIRHTGDGDGPGLGRCPVVLHDATISATPIDRGMRIVVLTGGDESEWLRQETRARMTELRVPATSTGFGMDHCPSSLPATATSVRDSDDGVVVSVISRDPDVIDAIRARAWHLSQESRRAGAHAEHAPAAAKMRRCPIVLIDTAVEEHDVPGGSELIVHPRLTGEAEDVRREAHARAEAFR